MPSLPDISEGAIFFSASKRGQFSLLQSTWPAKRAHLANFGPRVQVQYGTWYIESRSLVAQTSWSLYPCMETRSL